MPKIGVRAFEDKDKTLANFQTLADDFKWIYDHNFCYADVREENIRVYDDGTCHFVDFDNLVSSIVFSKDIQSSGITSTTSTSKADPSSKMICVCFGSFLACHSPQPRLVRMLPLLLRCVFSICPSLIDFLSTTAKSKE